MKSKKPFWRLTRLAAILLFMVFCMPQIQPDDARPNFLVIITDDQRYDTMQYMLRTQELIFDQGVTFTHGYITTPLCCPSRGLYRAYHTERYLYVETDGDISEFYDLEKDPFELQNAIDDPTYQTIISELKAKLADIK